MVINILKLLFFEIEQMTIANYEVFVKNYKLKDITMNESDLQRVQNYHIYLRDSKITTDKWFVNIDNGQMGGTHWTSFSFKNSKSF